MNDVFLSSLCMYTRIYTSFRNYVYFQKSRNSGKHITDLAIRTKQYRLLSSLTLFPYACTLYWHAT